MKFYKIIITLVFFVYVAGFLTGTQNIERNTSYSIEKAPLHYQEVLEARETSPFASFVLIAKNNLIVILKNVILGIFSFGVLSLVYTFYNGYIQGHIIGSFSLYLSPQEIISSTIPHSTELISLILSCLISFLISKKVLLKKENYPTKKIAFLSLICVFITIISALLESYVSMS